LDLLLPVYLPNSCIPLDEEIGCGMNDKMAAMDLRVVSLRIGTDAGLYAKGAHEIPTLISEYLEWAPKSRKELIHCGSCRFLCTLRRQGDALYPLGKLVNHHQDVFISSLRAR
jgi:hypothetical protein